MKHLRLVVVSGTCLLSIIWVLVVVFSGTGWNPSKVKWDFTNTAQLGDSFGVLSSLMASIAAYFAFATYSAAKDEAAVIQRRAAEPSFLNLLERRFDVMDRISATTFKQRIGAIDSVELRGQDAIDWASQKLWPLMGAEIHFEKRQSDYMDFINEKIKGLTNYHRFVFHIIAFAERQFSNIPVDQPMTKDDPAYGYVKLLRAQFSDEEMQLMALNAVFGAGFPKLKHYIERYALLNNAAEVDILEMGLDYLFEETAFGLLKSDRPAFLRSDEA